MQVQAQPQKLQKVVYTIVERQKDGRKFWLRIGAAFENRDGSLNVHLDAVPTNGKLQVRDYQPSDERVIPKRVESDTFPQELLSAE